MKILTILGAKPQFIKAGSVSREIAKHNEIKEIIVHTGQHYDANMPDIFFDEMKIPKPDYLLGVGGKSHGAMTGQMIEKIEEVALKENPDWIMIYGPLEELVKNTSKEYANIYFHKAVSPDVLLDYTGSADFGVSTIEDSCLSYRYCLPNKLFEYLMADVPVVVSNLSEMKRLVESNNIGMVAKEDSPEELKKAIEKVVLLDKEEVQKNIQKVKKIYNWEEQEKVLLSVYESLNK